LQPDTVNGLPEDGTLKSTDGRYWALWLNKKGKMPDGNRNLTL